MCREGFCQYDKALLFSRNLQALEWTVKVKVYLRRRKYETRS